MGSSLRIHSWHVLCIQGGGSVGTGLACGTSVARLLQRATCVPFGNMRSICCGMGLATCTCVPFVYLFLHLFFWHGTCMDLGRQILPGLTSGLASVILLFKLI